MEPQRLTQLINQLAKGIMSETKESFKYELCSKFDDCSRRVEKKCLFDYLNCSHYKRLK